MVEGYMKMGLNPVKEFKRKKRNFEKILVAELCPLCMGTLIFVCLLKCVFLKCFKLDCSMIMFFEGSRISTFKKLEEL